ncbi:hypothetical protein SLE2022_351470 [Rubroshorea leprosula]
MDAYALTASSLLLTNEFAMHDFIEHPNFDQFVDLIRGESENSYAGSNFSFINNIGCYVDKQVAAAMPGGDVFDYHAAGGTMAPDNNYIFNTMGSFNGEMNGGEEDESDDEEDESSETTTTRTTTGETKKKKVDRSKTLISERKRRGKMKEKLYALRSLVPNITKMDKASIIGDAVLYVQDLQVKANMLKADIAGLEAILASSEICQESMDNPKNIQFTMNRQPVCKKIEQMDIFQVEEKMFYIKLVCNRGEGVAVSLYKAIESLTGFKVQNTNLATVSDTFALTFSLKVRDSEQAMSLPNLKLWVTGALLHQGFEFLAPNLSS